MAGARREVSTAARSRRASKFHPLSLNLFAHDLFERLVEIGNDWSRERQCDFPNHLDKLAGGRPEPRPLLFARLGITCCLVGEGALDNFGRISRCVLTCSSRPLAQPLLGITGNVKCHRHTTLRQQSYHIYSVTVTPPSRSAPPSDPSTPSPAARFAMTRSTRALILPRVPGA